MPQISENVDLVPVERYNFCYTLGNVSKKSGARAALLQFPIKLSWAMTAHKCQGQSILPPNCILTDLNECFSAAQSYVILSRITSIDQLFLRPFDPKKIYCSSEAKEEVMKLRRRAINLQETTWEREEKGLVKICTLNVRSLLQHQQDLEMEACIMNSQILAMQETWLKKDPHFQIAGYSHQHFINAYSKGVALTSKYQPISVEKLEAECCSIIKAEYGKFDVINVYRFSNTSLAQFLVELNKVLNPCKSQVVLGDFNINLALPQGCKFEEKMMDEEFVQLVKKSTHIQVYITKMYMLNLSAANRGYISKKSGIFYSILSGIKHFRKILS